MIFGERTVGSRNRSNLFQNAEQFKQAANEFYNNLDGWKDKNNAGFGFDKGLDISGLGQTVVPVHRKVIGSGTNVSLISANAIFCWERLKRMQEIRRKLQLR